MGENRVSGGPRGREELQVPAAGLGRWAESWDFRDQAEVELYPLGNRSHRLQGIPATTRSSLAPSRSTLTMPLQRHSLLIYDLL